MPSSSSEAQGRQVEVDAKAQQQAQRWHIAKIALLVGAAITALVIAAVCGVKNVSLFSEFTTKVFDFRSKACMPRMDLIRDMYKPEIKFVKARDFKRMSGNKTHHVRALPAIDELMEKMQLEDYVGQIIQAEERNTKCWELRDAKAGAMFYAGDNSPGSDDASSWLGSTHGIQAQALLHDNHIPVLIGVDTIHGVSHIRGATLFPHNIGLGCTRNEKLIEEVGKATALEGAATGINWGFAPCVALASDIRWGRLYESFGQDADLVGKMGAAYVKGANSVKDSKGSAFITCGKHFVGDGGVKYGTGRIGHPLDRGDTEITMKDLRNTHLKPYQYLIDAGIKSMMASFSSINGRLMHGHKKLLTGELKEKMGFKGFVSSDYAAINALDKNYDTAVAKAINAGVDNIMLAPHNKDEGNPSPKELHEAIMRGVKKGKIPLSRVKDAARRVLWAKYESGLMEKPHVDGGIDLAVVGSQKHRELARQVVAESTVVLKNEQNIMPFDLKAHRVCVAGVAADDQGMQLGGWTNDWQGKAGNLGLDAVTIRQGVERYAQEQGMADRVTFSKEGDCQGSDIALVVVGEEPYAEFFGDRVEVPKPEELKLVNKIKKDLNLPVVLLAISGRPLDIDAQHKAAAGVVAAFLPGSEGGNGVTDVLFGKALPKGKLSLDWPKSGHAHVRNQPSSSLLYKEGDGLTWARPTLSTKTALKKEL